MADVKNGRGAWSQVGKDNGTPYYTYIVGKQKDGHRGITANDNYDAVHWGVLAIQTFMSSRMNIQIIRDGVLGKQTLELIKKFQEVEGLTADGKFGPVTAARLFVPSCLWRARRAGIPEHVVKYLVGQMKWESACDPGAVGYTTPSDCGLVQINTETTHYRLGADGMHLNTSSPAIKITRQLAHDGAFNLTYGAARFHHAYFTKYNGGKEEDLRVDCSIADHNAPAWAAKWYATGEPPNESIANYVQRVKELSE